MSELERPKINFDDVGGMKNVKEEINVKIIQPLMYPELYKAYGKKIGGGILLYGPPGCGKTHLARATAGQINASFISIGIHDVLDMWAGNSEKRLHELFELARRQTPCVLFFDEIDALGASRSDMRHSATKMLINQFLTELDGISASNDGVLILGATNAPWHLDTAFRRPGRFDRIIFVQPPDAEGRESILKIQLAGKPIQQIDYTSLSKVTPDFSGADLKAVVDITIEDKLRQSFEKGIPEPIMTKDLIAAAKKVKPSTKEWFNTARNYALYANDSGLYDEILEYLKIKK
jgi:SpoVK/Ycf46/Vps4 family AAA+-type ATPase